MKRWLITGLVLLLAFLALWLAFGRSKPSPSSPPAVATGAGGNSPAPSPPAPPSAAPTAPAPAAVAPKPAAGARKASGAKATAAAIEQLPAVHPERSDAGGVAEAVGSAPGGRIPGALVPPDDVAALGTELRRWLCDAPWRRRLQTAAHARRSSLPDWSDTAATVRFAIGAAP